MNCRLVFGICLVVIGAISCQNPYKVKSYSGHNILVDSSLKADSVMNSQIIPFKNDIDAKMDRIIGESAKELLVFKPESPLSNFVSDVIQQKALNFLITNKADSLQLMTLINVKGLRAPIPKGNVTVRNIFELMPFENEIVILTLSGDSIVSLFNFLGETDGDGIAGARVKYDNNKIVELFINDKPINRKKNYYLATSDYIANGGDHYKMIMNPMHKTTIGFKVREAIIQSIENLNKAKQIITAEVEGRIIFN